MDNYYEEVLKEIEALMEKEAYEDAFGLCKYELTMPYIPKDVEEVLIDNYNQCRSMMQSEKSGKVIDEDDLESLLKGSFDQQLLAVEQLKKSNIRNHLQLIEDYLKNHPHYLIRSFLVEALMEQNVTDEITMDYNGLEVVFTPCYIEPAMECDGAIAAVETLREWFENENPSFLMMCVDVLVKEVYLKLPFNVEEDESEALALAVCRYVFEANGEKDAFDAFIIEKGLAQTGGYELLLKEHDI